MQITITLPDSLTIETRTGVSVTLDISKLSADIVARGAALGLKQKVVNFAANALMDCKVAAIGNKPEAESDAAYKARLEKVTIASDVLAAQQRLLMMNGIARLEAGDWGAERTATAGLTEQEEEEATVTIALCKLTFDKGVAKTARIAKARAHFLSLTDEQRAAISGMATKAIAERKAAADRMAADAAAVLALFAP